MFYAPVDRACVVGSHSVVTVLFCGFARFILCGCSDTFELILQSLSFTSTVYSVFIASRGQNFTTRVPWANEMACCVSSSLERQLWKLLTLTTTPSKRAAVVCLVLFFFSAFFFCFWSRNILLTFLRSLFIERRYFTSMFFRIVLKIVPGIMGLYAVLCCKYTVSLHCNVKLRFKMNILCNNITSLDAMQPLQVQRCGAPCGLQTCYVRSLRRVVIIRMLHMKVVDVKSVAM